MGQVLCLSNHCRTQSSQNVCWIRWETEVCTVALMRDAEGRKTGSMVVTFSDMIHVLMRDQRRKEERSKQGQTNNKAKQHNTPKTVTFPKKNELPWVYMYLISNGPQ